MASWPSDLPQEFDQEGFGSGPPDNVLRTPVDAGPQKSRKRFTSAPTPLTGNMIMTNTQLESFKSFLKTIGDGALRFTFPELTDPTNTVYVKFTSRPQWVPARGGNWNVTMNMIILP